MMNIPSVIPDGPDDDKVGSPEIVDLFRGEHEIHHYRGKFYQYNGACFDEMSDGAMRRAMATFIRAKYKTFVCTARMVTECVNLLADLTHVEFPSLPVWLDRDSEEPASVLVVKNGVVDLDPMYVGEKPQLIEHTPELFAVEQSDFDYDETATCPAFDRFMQWFTCGNNGLVTLLLQFVAYILLRRLDLQKFLILMGQGANGKSVFLGVIERLVGTRNCSALNFERLGGKFGLATLCDKLVNIAADANEITKVAEGNLKMLVDRSLMAVEQKFKESFLTRCLARLIFACNVLPRFRERSDGIWRRLFIVPCLARVLECEMRRGIEHTFNLAGVLNRVLQAGELLIRDGGFSVPQIVLDATEAERLEANPTAVFLRDHVVVDQNAFVANRELYGWYHQWCESSGYKPLADGNFGKELRKFYRPQIQEGTVRYGKGRSRQGVDRQNGYNGLAYAQFGQDEYLADQEKRKRREAEQRAKHEEKERRKRNSEAFRNGLERLRPGLAKSALEIDTKATPKDEVVAEILDMVKELPSTGITEGQFDE